MRSCRDTTRRRKVEARVSVPPTRESARIPGDDGRAMRDVGGGLVTLHTTRYPA